MADLVVSEGYAALGYEYINVDDCWLEKSRGQRNELVADRKRFPRGMRSLSDYVNISRFMFELVCYKPFFFRFIQKDLSLEYMKITATTHALAIQVL